MHKCYQVISRQDADILQFNIIINFCWTLTVESSEIPKDLHTDRKKSPSSPFVLITPFDVDCERSLVKSISFTPANHEKSSTNHENSLVRTAHTETLVSTTLTPSITLISYERTSRMPTPILSPMQINLDKEIDYYNDNDDNDDDNKEHNDNYNKSDTCDKSDTREPLPKPHIVEGERYLTVKEFNYAMNALDGKVNAIYKLCRYIGDQQQKSIQDTQNIAKSDVLSDDFWNVS